MTLMEQCQIWNDNDEYQKSLTPSRFCRGGAHAGTVQRAGPRTTIGGSRYGGGTGTAAARPGSAAALRGNAQRRSLLELPHGVCLLLSGPGRAGAAVFLNGRWKVARRRRYAVFY